MASFLACTGDFSLSLMDAGECGGVIRRVRCRVLNESDEVMDGVLLIIRKNKEDLVKYLTDFRDIRVRALARDRIEFFIGLDEEGGNVTGQNCVHKVVVAVEWGR